MKNKTDYQTDLLADLKDDEYAEAYLSAAVDDAFELIDRSAHQDNE